MKARLQHFLHPLNLWCRVGGNASWCFKLYEKWVWQPLLRRLLSDSSIQTKKGGAKNLNISCAYCNKPLPQFSHAVTVCSGGRLYLFCTIGCRNLYGFGKLTNRVCAREGCNNRVPELNRMLCSSCHQRGKHLAESELSFDEAESAHWQRMEQELRELIEGEIRSYSSQEMSQEELRSLVPSPQEKEA